jgi:hypothetical protein
MMSMAATESRWAARHLSGGGEAATARREPRVAEMVDARLLLTAARSRKSVGASMVRAGRLLSTRGWRDARSKRHDREERCNRGREGTCRSSVRAAR